MAEETARNLPIALIAFLIFSILITTVVVTVGDNYGKDTDSVFGGLDISKLNSSLTAISDNATSINAEFTGQSTWSSLGGILVEGIFNIGKNVINLILIPFDIASDIAVEFLGVPVWMATAIKTIFILAAIFAIWSLIKIGN